MISYQGRSNHTVKLKNKLISEGYKVWVLGDSGYVYNWLWHSRESGPEGVPKGGLLVQQKVPQGPNSIHLAPTFALVIRLAEHLHEQHPDRVFCLFLDNLFLNINVAHALLALNICCTGTTRKNALGIPQWLIKLKEHNRGLVWNSTLAQIEGYTLCFLWQDNNAVLGITTAFRLKDETIWSHRKRPAPTSTNAHIVRPVFGDHVRKWLQIPLAIDQYNHYMGGVDVADQLRKNMTVHRPWEARNWRPLWYYILDTCLVNSYLIWKGNSTPQRNRAHRKFREELSLGLRNTPYSEAEKTTNKRHYSNSIPVANQEALVHIRTQLEGRKYCVWCQKHPEKCTPKSIMPVLGELVNEEQSRKRKRVSRSQWGCDSCGVCLCQKGDCWDQYHSTINTI
jgi:Transposase IS4